MFKFWGSQEERPPAITQLNPPLSTPQSSSTSAGFPLHTPAEKTWSHSNVSPSEVAGIISSLKDKSIDELWNLVADKDAYLHFLLSLDIVKMQNNIRDELRKETIQLARCNVEEEPRIMELRNQCTIIRTTELATAEERLNELEKHKEEMLRSRGHASMLGKLQEAMEKVEEESDALHRQLLLGDVDVSSFVNKFKKLRATYHTRALLRLSAKSPSS